MATLRSDGRWIARIMFEGKTYSAYGLSDEEAEEKLRAKLLSTSEIKPAKVDQGDSLDAFAQKVWMPRVETLSELTQSRYKSAYNSHIKPRLGDFDIKSLDMATLQVWMNSLELGAKSKIMVKSCISQILDLALDYDLIAKNPCRRLMMPKKPPKRERVLPIEKAIELLDKIEGDLSAPVFLAVLLGLRRGEICGLEWDKLDRQKGELKIDSQALGKVQKGIVDRRLKTDGSKRTLYLTKQMVEEIDKRGNLDSRWICTRKGSRYFPDTLSEDWRGVRDSLGLADWTFHDLRHGAAGLIYAVTGGDLLAVAAVLGHKHVDTSLIYASLQANRRKEVIELLADRLGMSS
jgi:integrase